MLGLSASYAAIGSGLMAAGATATEALAVLALGATGGIAIAAAVPVVVTLHRWFFGDGPQTTYKDQDDGRSRAIANALAEYRQREVVRQQERDVMRDVDEEWAKARKIETAREHEAQKLRDAQLREEACKRQAHNNKGARQQEETQKKKVQEAQRKKALELDKARQMKEAQELEKVQQLEEAQKREMAQQLLTLEKTMKEEAQQQKDTRLLDTAPPKNQKPSLGITSWLRNKVERRHSNMEPVADELAQNQDGRSALMGSDIEPPKKLTQEDELLLKNAREGRVKEVRKLGRQGADVNAIHQGGSTALHLAAVNGDMEMVKLLVELSADVHARDALGSTALHEAAGIGHTEMVIFLVGRGASINTSDADGDTPLQLARFLGHIETVKALEKLQLVADIPAHDSAGLSQW